MRGLLALLSFAFVFTAFPAQAEWNNTKGLTEWNRVEGYWFNDNDKDVVVHIKVCDTSICGKVYWMRDDLRSRAPHICDVTVFSEFKRSKDDANKWSDGTVYKASKDKYYKGNLEQLSDDQLKLRAYVGTPFLGKTVMFKRVDAKDYPACEVVKK